MKYVCIIPARGGSKGIPRKNLLPIAGKPLIVWSIEQALAADLPVYVSTEDAEIAAVSRAAGAAVIDRPDDLAQDTTASEAVIEHALAVLTTQGQRPDTVAFLQATSPVRLPGTLARARQEFEVSGADSMLSVVAESPFLWSNADPATPHYDVHNRPRRQEIDDSQQLYRENGSFYFTRTQIYETQHNRIGGRVRLFLLNPLESIDIDSPVDREIAEARLRTLLEK